VITRVSRETKPCSRCGRPRDRKGQRLCRECHAENMRARRKGKVEVHLTPEEWAAVKAARQAETAGRHARRSKEN
jgi:NMD protein affecting ribosome stability and mRNA decay